VTEFNRSIEDPVADKRSGGSSSSSWVMWGMLAALMLLLVGREMAAQFGINLYGTDAAVGKPAPRMVLETVSGQTLRFPEDFQGRLLLLDFWATWCGPCVGEIPHLKDAQRAFGQQGLTIVGVPLDGGVETTEMIQGFIQQRNMAWEQVIFDNQQLAAHFGVEGIPAAFLLDPRRMQIVAAGHELRGALLNQTLRKHLTNLASSTDELGAAPAAAADSSADASAPSEAPAPPPQQS
jgi:thiol-disulfide isomerase/thioredoxin